MWILFEGLKYAFVLLWQPCIKYVRQFYTVFRQYRTKSVWRLCLYFFLKEV